ncbi:MAG: RDD family protein [Terriglobia bacterium]
MSITDTKPVIVGAGFWIRALARALDAITNFVVGYLAGLPAGILIVALQAAAIIEPGWQFRLRSNRAPMFFASLVAALVYNTVCEGFYGATLGKYLCRLRVLTVELKPCGMKAALYRSLAYYFDALFFGLVGYMKMSGTTMEQRYGDHWAGTVVLRSDRVPEASRRGGDRFVGALAIATALSGLVVALALVLVVW